MNSSTVHDPKESFGRSRLTEPRTSAQVWLMDLGALWLRLRYACLLLSAKERVAAGKFEAPRSAVGRICDLYSARRLEAPINADIMCALVAWNMGEFETTVYCVRRAADKLGRRLTMERRPARRHELHYLRAYCWTLLCYSETSGGTVPWENFTDLRSARYVDLSRVNRTVREMFPVDEQVFVIARP